MVIPSFFFSHGAPTLALQPGPAGHAFIDLGERIRAEAPLLKGILVMSPHWITATVSIQSHLHAPILHDFSGFPHALYELTYPAPGSPEASSEIHALLAAEGIPSMKVSGRGLDHGAWVPLRYLFPAAEIPVLQISMPYPCHPSDYFRIGQAVRPMAENGYLIVGSGGLTHNLGHYRGQPDHAEPLPYVAPFVDWFNDRLDHFDLDALFNYRTRAPGAVLAHPTDDHLMPLFFALGAASTSKMTRLHHSVSHAILAMDLFAFGGSGECFLTPDAP